jgi:two-component system, OmpR family, phosphate regulon sensor histidine kinase PhoR
MKQKITVISILMALCVTAIAALQFKYSYTAYRASVITFKKESNEAFKEAVDSAKAIHRERAIEAGRKWFMDTTNVVISSRWERGDKQTRFILKQKEDNKDYQYYISSPDIPVKLDSVTPEMKAKVVNAIMGSVRDQLSINMLVYTTEGMAKAVSHVYYDTPIDNKLVEEQYRLALKRKEIMLPFSLNCAQKHKTGYITEKVNASISKPNWIYACFDNTDIYLLERLKWVIATSVVLILITLGCFWYAVRTLFGQERFSRLKDDFISNMTHEIHSPLSSVIITAEAMKEFDMTKEERDSYADIILHQSKKLSLLADEILAGAKLEKKGINLNDRVNLNSLLTDMATIYREKAIVDYMGEDVIVRGNKSHLERVIANILENAIKYNEADESKITIQSSIKGKTLEINIADNGPGIPDPYKAKVFEQFYRIPTGNVHNVKGYGLGLSYVKKVVEAHKGSIAVKDNNPSGSIFIIRIPYEV